MPEDPEQYDNRILSSMKSLPPFRSMSVEEIICLISIGQKIHMEHKRRKNEPSILKAHYHLPTNYTLAMEAWTEYNAQEDRNMEIDP